MSNHAPAAAHVPAVLPATNPPQASGKPRRRKAKANGNQGSANQNAHAHNSRNQGPAPGPAIPASLSVHQTILKNDPMFGDDLLDDTLAGFQPVSSSPKFCPDAGPSLDMMDACYATLRAKDPNVTKYLPYPLFNYYWTMLIWHRALHVAQHNQLRTDYWVAEFLQAMNSNELYVPKELAFWLHGLGNTKDPNGDLMIMDVLDVPSAAVLHGKQGSYGQYTPATAGKYATFPSPYITAAFIQKACDPAPDAPSQWRLGNGVDPEAINNGTDHRHLYTENLLGYVEHFPLRERSRSTLTDLGWRVDAVPPDTHGRFNYSASTMSYVSMRLLELSKKHPMTLVQGYTSALGSQAQMPFLSVPSAANDVVHVQRASKRFVDHHSRYQTETTLMSTSFICGWRVERRIYQPEANTTFSASYPIQIVDAAGAVQNQPPMPGWDLCFQLGDGATRMNHLYFRGSTSYRNDTLVKISAKIK
jgi:hypothetical protein